VAARVIVAEVRSPRDMVRVIRELGVADGTGRGARAALGARADPVVQAGPETPDAPEPTFLVKPAWFSPHRANFTGARELDLVLGALPPGRRIVVEGHSGGRNYGGREITPDNADENREWIREQDRLFLERTGIARVLERHRAEYLNVTEEVWAGRVAPAEEIRDAVERAFGRGAQETPVHDESLFGVVPQRLFELRGSVLVSLAKLKTGSWSLKNLFGLIPDPMRLRWHGERGELLGRSVTDIASIYRALFRVVGLVEGVYESAVYREGGRHRIVWGRYDVVEELGLVLGGWDLVTLDSCCAELFGEDARGRSFLRIGEAVFGEAARVPPELEAVLSRWRERLLS